MGWRGRGAVALASTVVGLVMAEGLLRLLGLAPGYAAIPFGTFQTEPDPELLWIHRPGGPGINAFGMRGPPPDAPKTRRRVLVLGDSLAFGTGLEEDETVPVRLQHHLAALGRGVEVLNGGVSGYNTVQEARWLERFGERLAPDHVVVLFCANDVDALQTLPEGMFRHAMDHGAAEALESVFRTRRHSPLQRTLLERCHLFRLVMVLSWRAPAGAPSSRRRGRGPDDTDFRPVEIGLGRIARWCDERGIAATVALAPRFHGLYAERHPLAWFHERVSAIAAAAGLAVLDLTPAVRKRTRSTGRPLHEGDRLHPNAEGADLFGATVARWLRDNRPELAEALR